MRFPEFINLRNFVEAAPNNPSKFSIESSPITIACKESDEISLCLNFWNEIDHRKFFNVTYVDYDPTLQIIEISTTFEKYVLKSIDCTENNSHFNHQINKGLI